VTSPAALLRCSGLPLAAVLIAAPLSAQGTTQLSATGVLVYPHSSRWTFVGELNPASVINGTPTWREMTLDVGAEHTVRPGWDLIGYTYAIFTNQVEGLNTSEFRMRLGVQPFWRLRPRLFLQGRVAYEGRFIHYQGGETDFTQRARVRVLSRITVRKANEYQPGAVYIRADAEGYIPIGDKANERYFNKVAFRGGAGYRISRHDQMEANLITRASTTTFGLDQDNADLIIELRYTHILRKRTPDTPHPSP
jgi:hypothetical protein